MANQVLRACGYSRFTVKVTPLTMPGLKTACLVGNLNKHTPPSYTSGTVDTPKKSYPQSSKLGIVDVEYKSKDDATDKAQILETENFLLLDNTRGLKNAWIRKNTGVFTEAHALLNEQLYNRIKTQKERKVNYNAQIQIIKTALSKARQELYQTRKFLNQLSTSSKRSVTTKGQTSTNRIKITRKNYLCHEKVKIIVLDGRLTLDDLTFSGTDNGIAKMTETSQFKVDRFKFHLDLQNRYSILSGSKDDSDIGLLDQSSFQY
ncbi:hypothetical protein INT47_013000 [Mucor saturninus]|uniref:Uncharacterized protein n=1 Tax=Mucor saturninus TaxID=64648 RepID=A0A8H7V4K9_9FUNG|nr:hypothetical protein INT47_013000 [Mucor saturninus]